MLSSERGIGNLAFIAVVVLLIISIALFFMAHSEAEDLKVQEATAQKSAREADRQYREASRAYTTLLEMTGTQIKKLEAVNNVYPPNDVIRDEIRNFLWAKVEEIRPESEAKILARRYQVDTSNNNVAVVKGADTTTIRLYGTPFTKETMTFRHMLDPLSSQFAYAAKAIVANNTLYETEYDQFGTRVKALQDQLTQSDGKYATDVSQKGQQADSYRNERDQMQERVNSLTVTNDKLQQEVQTTKAEADRKVRLLERERNAWKNRAIAEKQLKALALAEDPKDGEVLLADPRKGLVYINLGRSNKVSPGTKFTVWRPGKGNVRQDVATIRVFKVDRTRSTARILRQINRRVPVSQGMNISNPFFDPHRKLRVFIYGDLRTYPTDIAKRRLAESGVTVSPTLDDRVDVIVLGEPPVSIAEEDMEAEDEAESALLQRRMTMERDKNLRNIRDTAIAIGAIVVTESVLRTFIEY